jgi:hypothetical protein
MSQSGMLNTSGGGGGGSPIQTITGNDGVPTTPIANNVNLLGLTVANATNTIPVYVKHTSAATDSIEVQVTEAAGASSINNAGLASFNSAQFTVDANGFVSSLSSNTDLHAPRFIVASSTAGTGANYTTIASAIAAAQGTGINSTIFIQPGTYTENISLSNGINLTAFTGDGFSGNVTITGKITANITGNCAISGIFLTNPSDYILTLTNTGIVDLIDCFININGHDGINISAAGDLRFTTCLGNMGSAHKFFNVTNTDTANLFDGLNFDRCSIGNGSGITTASTISAGYLTISNSDLFFPITSSGTSAVTIHNSRLDTSAVNATTLTIGGSGANLVNNSNISSGTASSISAGGTLIASHVAVSSSNANAITGAGTLKYGFISFYGSSSTVNTTTLTPLATLI